MCIFVMFDKNRQIWKKKGDGNKKDALYPPDTGRLHVR